ncbi:PAS-domain containing protein [Ruixingdingia sedimenti]|uniref:PAS-domain containing protein n=1 Tax=Ruixingdingia sedimenti TaxID=3073604 RepID=A0ABU1F730_9RHOB|nr:PAS-domain containing protein [Xinfangfangia sp. LG-4]MDR5652685.1 PAS-domain containing protein [Xinfangfangia sp. LG-4]
MVLSILSARRLPATSLFTQDEPGTVLLFDGETLVDASDSGRALLAAMPVRGDPWMRFAAFAAQRFDGFEPMVTNLPDLGRVTLTSRAADPITLVAEWRGGLRKFSVLDPHAQGRAQMVDALTQRAQDEELESLRHTTDTAPFPIWREAPDGSVTWANSAYSALAARVLGEEGAWVWPLPRLFPTVTEGAAAGQRFQIAVTGQDRPLWFDHHAFAAGAEQLVFALPADGAVQAEEALREFVQTLTKTFAHLPIGLAIFDRQRRLQLFNPALTDLSSLPVDFLSARPSLFSFLDAMRSRRMIPEPKDYKSWRRQIAALEKSASEGVFEETWSLPSGLTYHVLGRPHPEGALALMIEDITDEISRTRRYRADVELGQMVVDTMEEAVAVFSPAGQVIMSNTAYAALWGEDPGAVLADAGASGLCARWQALTAPSPVWMQAGEFLADAGPRAAWKAHARLLDGRALACRFVPLPGGATLAGFSLAQGADQPPDARPARAAARQGA